MDALSIATLGIGFDALALATIGFVGGGAVEIAPHNIVREATVRIAPKTARADLIGDMDADAVLSVREAFADELVSDAILVLLQPSETRVRFLGAAALALVQIPEDDDE